MGILFWLDTKASRVVSLMPLGAPIGGVIAGAAVMIALCAKENGHPCARILFRLAFAVHLFLLVACVMDSAAYFLAYSRLCGIEWYAPEFAAAALLNLLLGFGSMFMLSWIRVNLREN